MLLLCPKDSNSAQLSAEVIDDYFVVGYQLGNVTVSIRSTDDLSELWSSVITGKNVILWCDGLRRPIQSKRSMILSLRSCQGKTRPVNQGRRKR